MQLRDYQESVLTTIDRATAPVEAACSIDKRRISEELGGILRHIATIASQSELDLEDIARENLAGTNTRWIECVNGPEDVAQLFDESFFPKEQLPRSFRIEFGEVEENGMTRVIMTRNGKRVGEPMVDNAYEEDGYRFHDALHLAFAALLGWSPVCRALMGVRRRSRQMVFEVEDAGRGIIIEEAIVALAFNYARRRAFLENSVQIDCGLLRTIKDLTAILEIRHCTLKQWESAILTGFSLWRQLLLHHRGTIVGDLPLRTIFFEPPAPNGN